MDDELAGRNAGRKWASALIEANGLKWLDTIEISDDVLPWDAFRHCVDPSGAASDQNIFEAMFSDQHYSAEYIAAFVKSALSMFQRQRDLPH
jgi:hypothetical protein